MLSEYLATKGKLTSKRGVEALHEQLLEEYGYIAPALKGLRSYEVKELRFEDLFLHEGYLDRVEERALLFTTAPIVGIVIPHGESYRLIDGYHRLKYCLQRDVESGLFLVLS